MQKGFLIRKEAFDEEETVPLLAEKKNTSHMFLEI